MKDWEGRQQHVIEYRGFTPEDATRLRPLALERAARMKDRDVCFICDQPIRWEDEHGYHYIDPPVIANVTLGLMIRVRACRDHTDLGAWPAADYELASWMMESGWGAPMDPAMLGDAQ